jgi:hypothetical protein
MTKKTTSKKQPEEAPQTEIKDLSLDEKLVLISQRVGGLAKEQETPADSQIGKWKYRGIDDIEDALRPQFVNCRVGAFPTEVESHYERVERKNIQVTKVAVEFVNLDNPEETRTVEVTVLGLDGGDKGPGKAMSYGTKIIYQAVFHLKGQPDVEADDQQLGDEADQEKFDTGTPNPILPIGPSKGKNVKELSDPQLQWIIDHWNEKTGKFLDVGLAAAAEMEMREGVKAQEATESEDQSQ